MASRNIDKSAEGQADGQEFVELSGQIARLVYRSEETGFAVIQLKVRGERQNVTAVGSLPDPMPGQTLKVRGEWRDNPKWGRQFQVMEAEVQAPSSIEGIQAYLQSGFIKGIGPAYAERIVAHFGKKTLQVLEREPDRLMEVRGIGESRLRQFIQGWKEHQDARELMLFLQSHGVGTSLAFRIFKYYGEHALAIVKENPYRLARDIEGVGFITADGIACKLGFAPDCELRAEAGLLHVLEQQADQGHVFAEEQALLRQAMELLDLDLALLEKALKTVIGEGHVVAEDLGETRAIYPAALHTCEQTLARRLLLLLASPKSLLPPETGEALRAVEKGLGIELSREQVEAVRRASRNKLVVITGGPGTGKTTILRALIEVYRKAGAKIALAAPTGRAAKRMSEATGQEAKTVHRLLEYSQQSGFGRDEDRPVHCHLLVVDEASMLDTVLAYHLLKATPLGATLVLVGDVDQLPSVGPGNVLGDVIASGVATVAKLTEIFRQARESSIVMSAHAIRQGLPPKLDTPDKEILQDFYFIQQDDPEKVADLVVSMVKDRIPCRFGLDPVEDVQVLSPMHKGAAGAENLNRRLQDALNPGSPEIERIGRRYRLNDKIMQIRNNYDKEVFNGDLGRVAALDAEARLMVVRFDDRLVEYDFSELDELIPAYAVSIHKSQGSEYPAVVAPLVTQHYILLQRNLLYTAVTRGKRLVVLVGSMKALHIALRNNTQQKRNTGLASRLRNEGRLVRE